MFSLPALTVQQSSPSLSEGRDKVCDIWGVEISKKEGLCSQPLRLCSHLAWLLEGPGEMRIGKEEEAADLDPLMASSSSLMSSLSSVQPALHTETAHVLLGVWDIPSRRPL